MVKYPTEASIKQHKDQLWTSLLQYYSGLVPIQNVEICLRSLMGDASLHVLNNLRKPLNLDDVKKQIASIRIVYNKISLTKGDKPNMKPNLKNNRVTALRVLRDRLHKTRARKASNT